MKLVSAELSRPYIFSEAGQSILPQNMVTIFEVFMIINNTYNVYLKYYLRNLSDAEGIYCEID